MTWAEIEKLRILGVITDPQAEVLQYRRQGFSYRQIAAGLNKSVSAIKDRERAAWRRITNHRENQETAA